VCAVLDHPAQLGPRLLCPVPPLQHPAQAQMRLGEPGLELYRPAVVLLRGSQRSLHRLALALLEPGQRLGQVGPKPATTPRTRRHWHEAVDRTHLLLRRAGG
jgi:hypothetical protein